MDLEKLVTDIDKQIYRTCMSIVRNILKKKKEKKKGILTNAFRAVFNKPFIKENFNTSFIKNQGSQYRTKGYTGLASGTIYFGYRLILSYRFGFIVICYIYK